jgi:hypothetical protein
MSEQQANVVSAATTASKLPDGVIGCRISPRSSPAGCRIFVHYNGPTIS